MDNGQENQKCCNCNKQFPSSKIDLHEAYCCRNIKKCRICQEMIDVNDMQNHQRDMHSKKPCTFCEQQFQQLQLQKHLESCPRRPVVCKFCQNQQPSADLSRHEEVCGSRTKPCPICMRNISLRDFEGHEGRCQRRRQERAQVSQDPYRNNRRNEVQRVQRERQNSTNNLREQNRSNSIQNKITKPAKIKESNKIGPETIKATIDPVPISIRLAMKNQNREQRVPLKTKN